MCLDCAKSESIRFIHLIIDKGRILDLKRLKESSGLIGSPYGIIEHRRIPMRRITLAGPILRTTEAKKFQG